MAKTYTDVLNAAHTRARAMQERANSVSGANNTWADRHCVAFRRAVNGASLADLGANVVRIIDALGGYADAHRKRYETPIGHDGVLGAAWATMAQGARTLLNGELGALDAGTLDGILCALMEANGVSTDGELWQEPT